MKSTVVIIGVATASVIGLTASAITGLAGTAFAESGTGIHAPGPDGAGPGGPGDDRPGPGRRHGPDFRLHLARDLAGLETIAGIRSDQLDAWRDYTSALLVLLAPPTPSRPAAANGPDAFGRAEHLADGVIARAATAQRLKTAIDTLRDKLTPEQIALLQQAEMRMGPRPSHPPFFGPGPSEPPRLPPPDAPHPTPDAG